MKKLLWVLMVLFLFMLGLFIAIEISCAADTKEVLNLKLQALDWEFRAQKADITLRRLRLQEIQMAIRKLRSQLKALKPKNGGNGGQSDMIEEVNDGGEAAAKKAEVERKAEEPTR